MDVRGGGQAADDKRVVKDADYASGEGQGGCLWVGGCMGG